jgi:hypothetical protein
MFTSLRKRGLNPLTALTVLIILQFHTPAMQHFDNLEWKIRDLETRISTVS